MVGVSAPTSFYGGADIDRVHNNFGGTFYGGDGIDTVGGGNQPVDGPSGT